MCETQTTAAQRLAKSLTIRNGLAGAEPYCGYVTVFVADLRDLLTERAKLRNALTLACGSDVWIEMIKQVACAALENPMCEACNYDTGYVCNLCLFGPTWTETE